ncbi:MAG: UDP-3-O-(3-hydroxymyristoyl)glucosamine N-acyltransferase [Rubritalea sp.]|uniref:UDP-3-O-(3-hydroxymyristoyl)glucosamine N-acyltransferase n=1 Tax=Rubritalea sp. TaxID=2109375 RepID=UPI0032424348
MQLTLEEIIELTGGKIVNEGRADSFSGLASLKEAGVDDVSFLGNEKYYADYLATAAGLVLVPTIVERFPKGSVAIEVENPSYAFGLIVKKLASKQRVFKPGVHPAAWVANDVVFNADKVSIKAGAVVESGSRIGDGTEINSNVSLGEGVIIGENCVLHSNVVVREFCELGDRVILQPSCVIGSDGYGYELVDGRHTKVDQVGIVVLEDDVEIGSSTTIDRARFGKTTIGEGTKIDNQVQVAHNVIIGKHCLVVAQTGLAGSCELGDYVTIAAQAGVAGHIKVGDQAVLLGRTGAAKNLEGGKMYMGMPARPLKEEQKKLASLARLPKLLKDFKDLKKSLSEAD